MTEEEYNDFYKSFTRDSSEPMAKYVLVCSNSFVMSQHHLAHQHHDSHPDPTSQLKEKSHSDPFFTFPRLHDGVVWQLADVVWCDGW